MTFLSEKYYQKTFPENCDTKEFKHRYSTRGFQLPDGTQRIANMQNWYWIALHWLCTDKDYDLNKIVAEAARELHTFDDPDCEFRAVLMHLIHRFANLELGEEDNIANENYIPLEIFGDSMADTAILENVVPYKKSDFLTSFNKAAYKTRRIKTTLNGHPNIQISL